MAIICLAAPVMMPETWGQVQDPITRSVHGKFNCITVEYDGTRHGISLQIHCTNTFHFINYKTMTIVTHGNSTFVGSNHICVIRVYSVESNHVKKQ